MPSGLTSPIYEGEEISFEQFALRCARAMTVLVVMRDEAIDAPIPEVFTPSDHYLTTISQLETKLAEIESWTPEQAESASKSYYDELKTEIENDNKNVLERKKRYEAMLSTVHAWQPPTPDHEGLKSLMIEQLTQDLRWHCCYEVEIPQELDGETFKQRKLVRILRDLEYYLSEYEKEVERATERTQWVQALRQSLENRPAEINK